MKLIHRKSTTQRVVEGVVEGVVALASVDTARRAAKWTMGLVGGAAAATAASAAVSSARQREGR